MAAPRRRGTATGWPGRPRSFPAGTRRGSAGAAGTRPPVARERSLDGRGERSERPVAETDEAAQADQAGTGTNHSPDDRRSSHRTPLRTRGGTQDPASPGTGTLPGWLELLDDLMLRIGSRFGRTEPRCGRGLSCWACWLTCRARMARRLPSMPGCHPDGMQHFLARPRWDADGVLGDLCSCLIEHLGDPDAVLVADETGDLKKGIATNRVEAAVTPAQRVDQERPGRRLPRLCRPGLACIDRPRAIPPLVLDRRPGPPLPGRRNTR